jgi:hypothetical protein
MFKIVPILWQKFDEYNVRKDNSQIVPMVWTGKINI